MLKGAGEYLTIYDINGIGKHNLSNSSSQSFSWRKISSPKELSFRYIDGKVISENVHSGKIIAVSEDRHFALLTTAHRLKKNNNIVLHEFSDVYAKVIGVEEDAYIISFTARTEGFQKWIDNLQVTE